MAASSGSSGYIPARGDLVWLSFDPQAGREQAGRRPAVVLSPVFYNRKSGLALVVPVTSHIKDYPFEVILPDGLAVAGAVLTDHVRSVDWRSRNAARIGVLPAETLRDVLQMSALLLT